MHRVCLPGLLLCLALCGCAAVMPNEDETPSVPELSQPAAQSEAERRQAPAPAAYVRGLAREWLAGTVDPGLEDGEAILAVYRRLMETVWFADPLGLDIWRYRDPAGVFPSFEETRALSPLAFGVGSCEDFAAALVVLLEEMGYEARYQPGYTISVAGEWVDHAWTVVRIGDHWYHIDAQLEQNVVRGGVTRYRFFLKSDEDLLPDHRWGENLIELWPDRISAADAQRIRELYTPPACERSWPAPDPEAVTLPERPNLSAIAAAIEREKAESGLTLPALRLNDRAPVLIGERDAGTPAPQSGRGAAASITQQSPAQAGTAAVRGRTTSTREEAR